MLNSVECEQSFITSGPGLKISANTDGRCSTSSVRYNPLKGVVQQGEYSNYVCKKSDQIIVFSHRTIP